MGLAGTACLGRTEGGRGTCTDRWKAASQAGAGPCLLAAVQPWLVPCLFSTLQRHQLPLVGYQQKPCLP